jgi:FkbM family methyltransferase
MKYSQNNESEIIDHHFGSFVGTILSVGENNGKDLSNALALIEKDWGACLIEPSPQVFPALSNLHQYNTKVFCYQLAIGDKTDKVILFDSGELLGTGDRALVSSVKKEETTRWASLNMPFNEVEVDMVTFDMFMQESPYKKFQFISIDAEGYDLCILRQMDLDKLDCRCLCIEHNGVPHVISQIRDYVLPHGFKEIGYNQENIIFGR